MEANSSRSLHWAWNVPDAVDPRATNQGETVEGASRTESLVCDTDRASRSIQEERLQDPERPQRWDLC